MPTNEANAILRGGPSESLSDEERIRHVAEPLDHPGTMATLKLMRGNRYEHWEPTPEKVRHGDRELRVFVWSGYTYLAE